jgi:hypothetical protein
MDATKEGQSMNESKEEAGAAAPRPRRHVEWVAVDPRVKEILDSRVPVDNLFTNLDDDEIPGSEETKTRTRKRDLLMPLAQEIAAMESDLKHCTHRDAKYFALLKAYEQALTTFKKL